MRWPRMYQDGLEDVEDLLNETTTAVTDYTELETHMKDATVRFDAVIAATEGDDALAQNVPDLYLDPVTLSFVEPDYSRLEKPVRPPPPPASAASPAPAQLNGHHMSTTSPDPFSNVVSPAEAQNLFNKDAFNTFSSSGFASGASSAFATTPSA